MNETVWRDVMIAWARHDELTGFTGADLDLMGAGQRVRMMQLDSARARGFLAGRALIRSVLDRLELPENAQLDSTCSRCGEPHAAPRTPGVALSVSHADDLVVVAASTTASSIGVDVEAASAAARVAEVASMFPAEHSPDLAAWTRIEAVVKADGRGFQIDPGAVQVRVEPRVIGRRTWSGSTPDSTSHFDVATIEDVEGYLISVARERARTPRAVSRPPA